MYAEINSTYIKFYDVFNIFKTIVKTKKDYNYVIFIKIGVSLASKKNMYLSNLDQLKNHLACHQIILKFSTIDESYFSKKIYINQFLKRRMK